MSTKRERRDAADVIRRVAAAVEDMPSTTGAYLRGYADGLVEARPADGDTEEPASGPGESSRQHVDWSGDRPA